MANGMTTTVWFCPLAPSYRPSKYNFTETEWSRDFVLCQQGNDGSWRHCVGYNMFFLIDQSFPAWNFSHTTNPKLLISALIAAAGYSVIVYSILLGMVRGFDHTVPKRSGTG